MRLPMIGQGQAEAHPTGGIAKKIAGDEVALNLLRGCQKREGLLTFYLDSRQGKVWLEVPRGDDETGEVGRYLYLEGLVSGLGSNPVGLDRGQLGPARVVVFRRVGGRLLIEQPNLRFRALSGSEAERRAVRDSFATSVLWAGDIVAADAGGEAASNPLRGDEVVFLESPLRGGRAVVDFTSFVVRDAHGVTSTLKRTGQGKFSLDMNRSVLESSGCLAFPDNVEFEALLTFKSDEPGRLVRSTAPTAAAVSLTQHHCFVRLPDDDYRPRRFDPRAPSFGVTFQNYAAPLSAPLETKWIARHRLEKLDPSAPRSRVKKPIVYYVDSGAPEPVRSALIEGAAWWNQAFEAAGFIDAFRVEVLPEGVHPLDVRYNVIQWVHRSTRGWSYGGSVTDPRTGEIIKGHVSLGSLRVRQDRLLFEGLVGTDQTGSGRPDDPIELALARIRQLAAHEVGHTLGFAHNFAASTYADRASVMDYPAPKIGVTDAGKLDLSDCYAVGIGEWDKFAVQYAYSQFTSGVDEATELNRIVLDGLSSGLLFLSDNDARPAGAAHPLANLWDNGADPVVELEHTLRVRRIALERFGERNVMPETPLAKLHEVLVPVYFHHRYQLAAAVKTIGGMDYRYCVRGDGQPNPTPIDSDRQRQALEVVLRCTSPEELDLPETILSLLAPRPFGYSRNREMAASRTGAAFDSLGLAATAAEMAVSGLLHPQRCARLVDFHRRDPAQLSLQEVIDALVDHVFAPMPQTMPARQAEIQRAVHQVVVSGLIRLASDPSSTAQRGIATSSTAQRVEATSSPVIARAEYALARLKTRLLSATTTNIADQANHVHLLRIIDRFLNRPLQPVPIPANADDPPPGSPIGSGPVGLESCSFEREPGAMGRNSSDNQ